MDATNQATDSMARIVLLGTEYTLRITGTGAKNLAALIATAAKGTERTKGKIRLESLLKSGKPLSVFELKREDVGQFATEAKRYGILYTVIAKPSGAKGSTIDVLVRADDTSRINRIFEKLQLGTIDKDAVQAVVDDIKASRKAKTPETRTRSDNKGEKAKQVIDDLLKKSTDKERVAENPTAAKMATPSPSEHSSEKGRRSAEGTEKVYKKRTTRQVSGNRESRPDYRAPESRRSVKEEMAEIRSERTKASKVPSVPKQTQHKQPAASRGKTQPEKGR